MQTYSTIVVSIYGRGNDIAASLKAQGLNVLLVDLSAHLGKWSPEEIEGAFGYLKSDKLTPIQMQRLAADDSFVELEKGLTLWFGQKLLELKSPMASHLNENFKLRLESLGAPPTSSQKSERYKYLKFFNGLSKTTYGHLDEKLTAEESWPQWVQGLAIKNVTRQGFENSHTWLQDLEVEVVRNESKVIDLAMASRGIISGVELQGTKAGVHSCEQLVWCLSSEETKYYSEKIHKKLFNSYHQESEWCWLKYRVSVDSCPERERVPSHWVLVSDVDAPWTHENLLVLQRTASAELFDVWVRLPSVQRFNKNYLEMRGRDVLQAMSQLIPINFSNIHSYPQEYMYTYLEVGAPRYPLYAKRKKPPSWSNVHFSSPEVWGYYGWDQILLYNQKIDREIKKWWQIKQQKIAKANKNKEVTT